MEQRALFTAADDDDKRHLQQRLHKPPLSPIRLQQQQQTPGPEDDDDFITNRDVHFQQRGATDKENSNGSSNQPQQIHPTTSQAPPVADAGSSQSPASAALSRPRERMYPQLELHSSESSRTTTRMGQESALVPKEIRSEPSSRHGYSTMAANPSATEQNRTSKSSERQSVLARLLSPSPPAAAPPIQSLPPTRPSPSQDFWRAVTSSSAASGYGSSSSSRSQGRRHSILRFGSSRRPKSERGMKKSASVEFKLHEEAHLRHASSDTRSYGGQALGRDMPRRLTEEEKEDLYRIRPDLEIGPTPFFQEHMAELQRRNQKRVLFAMFGGLVSIVLLLVFYALLARG